MLTRRSQRCLAWFRDLEKALGQVPNVRELLGIVFGEWLSLLLGREKKLYRDNIQGMVWAPQGLDGIIRVVECPSSIYELDVRTFKSILVDCVVVVMITS